MLLCDQCPLFVESPIHERGKPVQKRVVVDQPTLNVRKNIPAKRGQKNFQAPHVLQVPDVDMEMQPTVELEGDVRIPRRDLADCTPETRELIADDARSDGTWQMLDLRRRVGLNAHGVTLRVYRLDTLREPQSPDP
jgi:hypothetical protein